MAGARDVARTARGMNCPQSEKTIVNKELAKNNLFRHGTYLGFGALYC
jgi:hypothetical protein